MAGKELPIYRSGDTVAVFRGPNVNPQLYRFRRQYPGHYTIKQQVYYKQVKIGKAYTSKSLV